MIICNMESMVITRPPVLPPIAPPLPPPMMPPKPPSSQIKRNKAPSIKSTKSSTTSQGFRLLIDGGNDQGDTGSVYSIYKQKIDAMFEPDTPPMMTHPSENSVQARIEKMFTDVAKDNGIPLVTGGVHSFSVDYLGSVPLDEKVTSLTGLQNPLRDLYFTYKRTTKKKKILTGRLEISSQGLKVQYQGGDQGDLEQLNSFPTIAVWSAVKFVIQEHPKPTYAFLPLITDPDNIDKKMLFRNLDQNQQKYINSDAHSPLFAVVMRKIGIHKQLECHGFVCQTSEDAIVIAATLYKSLMAHMKAKEKKPKNRNGITCRSIASSTPNDKLSNVTPIRPPRRKRSTTSSLVSETDNLDTSDTQPLLVDNQGKKHPPKRSVKSRRAPKAPDDFDAIVPYDEETDTKRNEVVEIKPKTFSDQLNTYMSREQRQITAEIKQVMSESTNRGLKHVVQRISDEATSNNNKNKENSGDILTKVTIPRSGSFLNAGGLMRYKSKVSRGHGQATGGSPLGFSELFNEFRLQEGLHSIDEILGVIIDPEGMSFNDLKPIYKEFLLKLSVTLTKDELYQRSKLIMRRQKKKLLKTNKRSKYGTKQSHHISVGNKFKRLKHIFQKNFKLKLAKSVKKSKTDSKTDTQMTTNRCQDNQKLPESSISTSSYDTRQFTPKRNEEPLKKPSYRKKTKDHRLSTSEESDFFSVRRKNRLNQNIQQNRNSSSGYVSCSECSYDSDTCTCTSADKCYCSLVGNKKIVAGTKCGCQQQQNDDLILCECDTDSCNDSNKCYCHMSVKNGKILEQLKKRGLLPPPVERMTHKKTCKKNTTKSTKSLEYMHNPNEMYYEKFSGRNNNKPNKPRRNSDNLALDYELFNIRNNVKNRSFYSSALSGRFSAEGVHQHLELKQSKYGSVGGVSVPNGAQTTAISSGACTEALSVKKTAEIAALFADIKLTQTTDIAHLAGRNCESISNRNKTQNSYYHYTPNFGHRIVQNALYARNNPPANNKMYSARNGLYTIQSQSDESRRSSVSGGDGRKEHPEYFELEPQFGAKNRNSSTVENLLGYLP